MSASLIYLRTIRSKEKKYAHYIGQASWAGVRIIQGQWTPQAQKLNDLLILIFSDKGHLADLEGLKQRSGLNPEEWDNLVQYTTQVPPAVCVSTVARYNNSRVRAGLEQPGELQELRIYQDYSSSLRGQVCCGSRKVSECLQNPTALGRSVPLIIHVTRILTHKSSFAAQRTHLSACP